MNEKELKPCPFCGETPMLRLDDIKVMGTGHYVECMNEDCVVNVCTRRFDTQDEAIGAWNHRAMDIKMIKTNTDEIDMKIKESAKFLIEVLNNIIEELDYEETDYAYVKQLMITAYCTFKNMEVLVEDTDCLKSKEK